MTDEAFAPKFDLTDEFVVEVRENGAGVPDDKLWSLIDELAAEVLSLRDQNKRMERRDHLYGPMQDKAYGWQNIAFEREEVIDKLKRELDHLRHTVEVQHLHNDDLLKEIRNLTNGPVKAEDLTTERIQEMWVGCAHCEGNQHSAECSCPEPHEIRSLIDQLRREQHQTKVCQQQALDSLNAHKGAIGQRDKERDGKWKAQAEARYLRALLPHLVDVVWGDALESEQVPDTKHARKLIAKAELTYEGDE